MPHLVQEAHEILDAHLLFGLHSLEADSAILLQRRVHLILQPNLRLVPALVLVLVCQRVHVVKEAPEVHEVHLVLGPFKSEVDSAVLQQVVHLEILQQQQVLPPRLQHQQVPSYHYHQVA